MSTKKLRLNIGEDGQLSVRSSNQGDEEVKRKIPLGGKVVISEDKTLHFTVENRFQELDVFFEQFLEKITDMRLTDKNTNTIVELSEQLIESHTNMILKLVENDKLTNEETVKTIKETSQHINKELKKVSTASKRLIEFRNNPLYVKPEENTLQLKWRSKALKDSDLPCHSLVPSTCQFVPISKTLKAIFSQQEYQSVFTKYNSQEKHQCKNGVYANFCCGSTYKSKEIFRFSNVIQIEMSMDDFEICSAVKSKATKHKICGIYFQIKNLPSNISSKIDNIYLVALATSSDLKDDAVLNDLNELILEDLSILETEGFQTTDGKLWKAALDNISCDNLGANQIFGFSKGFHSNYYCRLCEMTSSECEITTHEITDKLRTKQSHDENIAMLKEDPSLKLKDTQGVRMDCAYNSLESYNLFDNPSIDIMHDIHEGVIPSFLSVFFNHCIENGVATEDYLVGTVRDHAYGPLYGTKKPSLLGLKKPHLGQNASQAYCLILHLPFMFYHLKEKLRTIWTLLEELLQCLQIIISVEITESDLVRLERHIDTYLQGMLKFKGKLIPKEHFLTHYPNVIRKIGPLKHHWTMRFECKHKFFTDAARITCNFRNINKTLAQKHQEYICLKKYAIEDEIVESKRITSFRENSQFSHFESFLESQTDTNIDFNSLFLLPFLKFNNYHYEKGLVLVENLKTVYDIIFVLKMHDAYYFLVEIFETKNFERYLNSIEIEPYSPEKQLAFVKHSDLNNKQSFSKKICNNKIYVIAENLTITSTFDK